MSINFDKIKGRLSSLTNTNQKSVLVWKPKPGKHTIRIVPYKFQPDNPFIELKFHYNFNNKSYISPDTFGKPDPIVEFANKLKKSGDKEAWKEGKNLEPKLRTYVPVIVRGEEELGVRFWGFGKKVYEELLGILADGEYGDITDLQNGRDISVEFKEATGGAQFPTTSIRVKPNTSVAVDPKDKGLLTKLGNQTDILTLFPVPTYDELKLIMDQAMNPVTTESDSVTETATVAEPSQSESVSPTTQASKSVGQEDVQDAFDKLFNDDKS